MVTAQSILLFFFTADRLSLRRSDGKTERQTELGWIYVRKISGSRINEKDKKKKKNDMREDMN